MSEFRAKKIANQMGTAAPDTVTAPLGDSSKKVATTEFVSTAVSGLATQEYVDQALENIDILPTIALSGLSVTGVTIDATGAITSFKGFDNSTTQYRVGYGTSLVALTYTAWTNKADISNFLVSLSSLNPATTYFVRAEVRDTNRPDLGVVLSNVLSEETENVYVSTPTLTVAGAPLDVTETPLMTGSAFSVVGGSATHVSTDWVVLKTSDSSVVWSSLANTSNKTSITVPAGNLEVGTKYTFRVKYNSDLYGSSGYGEVIATTKTFFYEIPVQGALGFSVAPCPDDVPYAALGLSEMTGTKTVGHDNYGNYQHTNGSIVCFMPRMWYRVGNASSPRYATYGANALDMLPASAYGTEAAANADGYILPRAFINGGAIKSGFFIDKYKASKKVGDTNVAVSVKNGNPIGLTTNTSYTPSSTMTGCTGILADAVILSRARGTGWQCTTIFQRGWLTLTSLAQAQSATSTATCAWYDGTGVMNFPKGCNNGSRADVNDTSVTWSASPDTAAKGLTGSASNFAKSTHNGGNNGVADVNGLMYEVDIGMTYYGSSSTDSAVITSDQTYVLKQSIDISTLTGGWGGATDVWGSNNANFTNKYNAVTAPLPIGSSQGAIYWGNGSNAVINNSVSGVGRDLAGFFPKDSNSVNATGTNLFGNDYFYKYNIANQFVQSCGRWSSTAAAGSSSRDLTCYRSSDSVSTGFRSCAYAA